MTEKKREVNGLRTAVRYGKLTKDEALAEYNKQVATNGVRSEAFEKWLQRR
jgi:hypothetical protein